MSKLRIMLAEDHETVREGLKMIVDAQDDMEVMAVAGDGLEAVTRAQQLLPDVLVMDVSMPKLNGLKATQKLKEVCPQVKVLTLSRHADDGYVRALLGAGARGYVLKQSAPSELIHAIRAVASGGNYIDPKVAGKVIDSYSSRTDTVRGETKDRLSDRESEVLRLIAVGYSNKEIAARLSLSVKTIEVHKANAMRKLNLTSRIELIRYAMFQGWLQDN
jgi:DNA-binding NarL/FixJ family response regulator